MLMVGGFVDRVATVGGPPLWQTALLDRPWIGAIGVLAVCAVAGVLVNRSGRGKLGVGLLALGVVLAAGIMVAGTLITTPEAMLRERTERFVQAVAEADPETLEGMLSPRFVVASKGVENVDLGGDWLVSVAGGMDRAIRSNEVSVLGVEMQDRRAARVAFRCSTVLTMNGQRVGSTWEVQWQRFEGSGAEAWKAVRLEAQTIAGRDPGRVFIEWGNRYRMFR